jgi:hypothetical protein
VNRGGRVACASTFHFGVGPTRLIVLGLVEKKGKAKGREREKMVSIWRVYDA